MAQTEGQRKSRGLRVSNPYALGIILLIAGISTALIQYKTPTILTDLMERFAMDASTGSWLMSLFTLMYIFVAIPTGKLASRLGPRNLFVAGLVLAVLGSLVGLFSKMNSVLLFSRALEGAAQCIVTTAGPIVIQRAVAANKISTTMSIWALWGCLGSTGASIITPTIFQNMGFGGLWLAYAVVSLVMAIVVLVLVGEPGALKEGSYEGLLGANPPRYRELLTKDIALFFVSFIVFNLCLLATLAYVPTILQAQGYSPQLSGFISTLSQLLSIVSAPLFGAIADRTGRIKPFLILSVLVMGPCTFVMYTSTGPLLWVADVVMGIVGMGAVGLFLSALTKMLPRPELGSISMGVMMCMQGAGSFLGSWFMQLLLGPSLSNYLLAGSVVMILGFVATACLCLIKLR